MLDMFEVPPYNRKIDKESTEKIVNAQPIIDMNSLNPISYYQDKHTESAVPLDVTYTNPSGDYVSTLTVYQREDKDIDGINARHYPPVLYAAKVGAEGEQFMVPIDTAAPGTVKVLDTASTALAYPKLIPNVYAIYKDDAGHLFFIDAESTESNMINLNSSVKIENIGPDEHPVYQAIIQSGQDIVKVPAFTDITGQPLDIVHIQQKVEMEQPVVQPNLSLSQNNFVTMSNGLRLYISNTEPVNDGNIPIGSIGIGW